MVIHPVISLHVNPFEPGQSGGAPNIELLRLLSSAQIESEWSECTTPTSLD